MNGGRPRGVARLLEPFRRKFVRDTIVLQVGMVVTMATYLVTSVLLARGLGPLDFGRYTLAFSLYVVVYFIANLGVTTATVSRYAEACGRRDEEAKALALATFLKAFTVMALLILAIGLALPALGEALFADAGVGHAAWLLCWLGPTQMTNAFVLVVLQGERRMREYVLYDNACGVLRLFLLLGAVLTFQGLLGVVYASLAAGVLTSLCGWRQYVLARRQPGPLGGPPSARAIAAALPRARILELFSSSTLIAVSKNGQELLRNVANLLIGRAAGAVDLAHFRVAFYYVWAIQQLLGGLGRSLLPALGVRLGAAQGDVAAFRRDLVRVGVVSGALFIATTALFVLLAPLAIRLLYGPAYADAVPLVFLLALGHLALGFAVVLDPFYIYTRQLGLAVKVNLGLIALVLLPAAWFLIDVYGVVGGALFMSLAQLTAVVHFVIIARWFRRTRNGGRVTVGA